jgi:signal transduction histidine kinase/CheY-like chemotaxis protein
VSFTVDWGLRFSSALHRRSVRYVLAVGIVGVATLLRFVADPAIHDQIPYFIYVAAVAVATWSCGVDGGIFSAILSGFVGNYFFVAPRYELIPQGEDWIAMAMFVVVAFGLVWQVGRWKRAERVLQGQARVLRQQADDLRVLHAEAERLNRVKDEFLATLSHELRTPLNAILGWACMLSDGRLDGQRQKDAVMAILRNAQAQSHMVNDILDVSRIISGKLRLAVRPVDLAGVVSSAVDMIRPAAEAKHIRISTALTPHSIIVGDADRLQQVVWNLLSNAVKFTPKGGCVDVRVEPKDSQLALSVSDTGIGIEPSFLPHLFQRFRQADSSTTRQHGGLGLGLAVVRHMVELHGGTVSAESAGLDHGATFLVTLPVRAVAMSHLEPETGTAHAKAETGGGRDVPALNGTRVLVVDDEPDAREMLQAALAQFGADVRTAADAQEATDLIQQWHPDVLAADIGMPGEDGYTLIRRVRALPREQGGTIPAIAVTAYAQDEDRVRALASGYQEHMPKPVEPLELAVVVGNLAKSFRETV